MAAKVIVVTGLFASSAECEMKARVSLLTGSHLCHNPRAIKEAAALTNAGYEVVVLGAWTSAALKERDQKLMLRSAFTFVPVIDATLNSVGARLHHWVRRARGRFANLAFQERGIESRYQLGPAIGRLLSAARRTRADLFIAHSEAGLYVAGELASRGALVAVDMEDWFSEDLLPAARRARPVRWLHQLERALLTGAPYTSCPSAAMSQVLRDEYGCSAPVVLYNAFPWKEREELDGVAKDREQRSRPSIHWYSQTLGEGRGVEDLLASLPYIQADAEIHLRGMPTTGFESWLRDRVPVGWKDRVFVLPLVSNDSLLSRIAEHDIGFAGERSDVRSRDLTVTNKILHYMLGGLAVVASDTSGQREVAERAAGAVHLYPNGNAEVLASKLNMLLSSPRSLSISKDASLRAAHETFCWEKQEPVLVGSVDRALARARR